MIATWYEILLLSIREKSRNFFANMARRTRVLWSMGHQKRLSGKDENPKQ
jgi:hypothetical protein